MKGIYIIILSLCIGWGRFVSNRRRRRRRRIVGNRSRPVHNWCGSRLVNNWRRGWSVHQWGRGRSVHNRGRWGRRRRRKRSLHNWRRRRRCRGSYCISARATSGSKTIDETSGLCSLEVSTTED